MSITTLIDGKGRDGSKAKDPLQKKPLKETIAELQEHDSHFWNMFRGSGLSIKPGSIFKVTEQAYENWGVKLTPENKESIRGKWEHFYKLDLDERDEKSTDIGSLVIQPFTHYMNAATNAVGKIVKNIMKTLRIRRSEEDMIKICVFGSRNGGLIVPTISAIRNLDAKLLERIQFYLVEPSIKIERARDILPTYGVNEIARINEGGFAIENKTDERFLSTQDDQKFDMVISLFHMHSKPFPDYLLEMHRIMRDDAALVIADNYSPLWQHPLFVYELLTELKADRKKVLDEFKAYFSVKCDERPVLTELEQGALRDHRKHMLKIAEELRAGPNTEKPVYVFRAVKTVEQGIQELYDKGFNLKPDEIAKLYPEIGSIPGIRFPYHLIDDSEYITLLAAIKG